MNITAKFRCDSKFDRRPEFEGFTVRLNAVYSDDPANENHAWSKATPAGTVDMHISNPEAFDAFERGKEYLVTFAQLAKLIALALVASLLLAPATAFAQAVPAPTVGDQVASAFFQYGLPPLLAVLFAVLTFALTKLTGFLVAKTTAATQGSLAARGLDALTKFSIIVQHFVADAEVSLKPQFVKALEDGKLSPEEGAALKALVLAQLKEKTAPELLGLVKAELGGTFEQVVGGMIEGAVAKLASSPAVLSPPPDVKPTPVGPPTP